MSLLLTVYITANVIIKQDFGDWEAMTARLRNAHVGSVVLESYRGGLSVDESTLRAARDRFESAGFQTMGGLMPVWGYGFGKRGEGIETRYGFFCYSDEATVALLEGEVAKAARVFHQVVIDDGFLTTCRCGSCDALRKGRPWGESRRELLTGVSARWVKAAHAANPNAVVTVKFPQSYDRHQRFGYNAERFPPLFDKVWIGTETRNPDTPKYGYTQQYQGYFNARWARAISGGKFEAGWIDFLDADDTLFYEQALSTALGGPQRMVLFCFGDGLLGSKLSRVSEGWGALERVCAAAVGPEGVYVPKLPNSEGGRDLYIYDDLGMMGIPCVPGCDLTTDALNMLLTTQAMEVPEVAAGVIRRCLERGGQVILTRGALDIVARTDRELLGRFGYTPAGLGESGAEAKAFEVDGKQAPAPVPVHIPGDLEPDGDTRVLAWAVYGTFDRDKRVALATCRPQAGGGRAVVWNLETFGHDAFTMEEHFCVPVRSPLSQLPAEVIGALRASAMAPMNWRLEMPNRIATFLFRNDVVFVNYTGESAAITSEGLAMNTDGLFADAPATVFDGKALRVAPHSFALVPRTVAR